MNAARVIEDGPLPSKCPAPGAMSSTVPKVKGGVAGDAARVDAQDIKAALNERAEEFARWLFPAGRKNGNEWQVGSLNGEAGQSLKIIISGAKVGVFKDFATGEGGDNLVELLSQRRSIAFKEALRACADWLGVSITDKRQIAATNTNESRAMRAVQVSGPVTPPPGLAVMPEAVRAAWREGVDFVLAHPGVAESLAEFRGWPPEFAHYLANCAAISMPLYHGRRGLAFLVAAPEGERGAMTTRDIGYHIRLKPKSDGKASWRYLPNEVEHGQAIPALPFIVGDFDTANLLVIAEGQWDALTFALAAGWLGDGCEWPAGVGLIGIRGASGVDTFLQWYRRFWPHGTNCLVLADADPAGSRWYNGEDCFTAKLSALCRKVAVVDCAPHKDFNELYRHERVGPDEIRQLLESHGMAVESEVLA
jgi:hypothetical protein